MLPLILLLVVSTQAVPDDCIYKFDNRLFRRTSVLTIKGLPTNLVYNPNTDDLFFTLIDLDTLQDDNVQTKMDQYVLKSNSTPKKIEAVHGQSVAIDRKRNIVYLGTDSGIHVLNKTYDATFLSMQDEDIVQLVKHPYKNELYAVMYPENEVYVIDIKRNERRHLKNVPCAYILAVDREDNVYFECDSKYVKMLLKGFHEPIEFAGIQMNSARALSMDSENRVILASNDGLYHLMPDSMIPKKLMDLEFWPSGLEFNSNDMYISTTGIIYKYSSNDCKSYGPH